MDASHIYMASNRSYNNEDALQNAIYLAFIYVLNKYMVVKEMTTGKGFSQKGGHKKIYCCEKTLVPANIAIIWSQKYRMILHKNAE